MKDNYDKYWETAPLWMSRKDAITKEELSIFRKYLKDGTKCLDYGCGDADRYPRYLVSLGVNYTGYDISQVAVAKAQANGFQAELFQTDNSIGCDAQTYDAAICLEVFEHLMEPDIALRDMHLALKLGGILITSVPNAAFWTHRLEFLLTGFFNPGGSLLTARKAPWRDPHIRFFNPGSFRRFVRSCGFQVVEFRAEGFNLRSMPLVHRTPVLARFFHAISWPVRFLGFICPSLFSPRIFIVARKPA